MVYNWLMGWRNALTTMIGTIQEKSVIETVRICTQCGEPKPLAASFYRFKHGKGGYQSACKLCDKARVSNWTADNKYNEVRAPKVRAYYRNNPERQRDASIRWLANGGKVKRAAAEAKRRAAKLNATPTWADKNLIEEFYLAADFLGMVTGIWHHVDHVVPIQGETVCGLHWEGNLQVLTGPENCSKSNRYWPDMPEALS
jgi:hypothetical protein